MDKKALEAIVEMAKAAGADVKVVEIKGNESEEGNKENLPTIPLLKFEVGLEKNDGELFAKAISSNHQNNKYRIIHEGISRNCKGIFCLK